MPLEETPTPPAAGDKTIVPTPPVAGDNAAFARLRMEAAEAQKRAGVLEEQLKAIERKDMDEKTRLEAELADARKAGAELETLRGAHTKFTEAVEAECLAAIVTIPEEKRGAIENIVKHVPLDERLTAIRQAITALGVGPVVVGTRTQPGSFPAQAPGAPEPGKPLTAAEVGRMSFRDAMTDRITPQVSPSLAAEVAAMRQELAELKKGKS